MTGKQKPEFGSIFRHIILKGISAQVTSAAERVNAGIAVKIFEFFGTCIWKNFFCLITVEMACSLEKI
jgi:hypothetical protein